MRVLQALITTTIVECVSDHTLNKLDIGEKMAHFNTKNHCLKTAPCYFMSLIC